MFQLVSKGVSVTPGIPSPNRKYHLYLVSSKLWLAVSSLAQGRLFLSCTQSTHPLHQHCDMRREHLQTANPVWIHKNHDLFNARSWAIFLCLQVEVTVDTRLPGDQTFLIKQALLCQLPAEILLTPHEMSGWYLLVSMPCYFISDHNIFHKPLGIQPWIIMSYLHCGQFSQVLALQIKQKVCQRKLKESSMLGE